MARRRRWHFTMAPLEHVSLLWMDDVYRGRLTGGGRVLLWATVACGVMILGGLVPHLIFLFGWCLACLVLAPLLGLPFMPRVRLQRQMRAFPSAGETFSYLVEVENLSRWTLRDVLVEERGLPLELRPVGEAARIRMLRPKERALVRLQLRCTQRGAWRLERLQAATAYPTALVKMGRCHRLPETLLVYPHLTLLPDFEVPFGRHYQPGGLSVASQVGDSAEFVGLREWRDGDRLRDVHWPAYARTARLVVRETQEEYFVRLALVMDVAVRNWKDQRRLETALSLAAGMADALARRDYIIDLVAAGRQVFTFRAGRALAHMDNILQVLAGIEEEDGLDVMALQEVLVPQAQQLSAVIMVMMDWDPTREALVQALKQQGVAVRVLCVRTDRQPTGLAPDEVVALP